MHMDTPRFWEIDVARGIAVIMMIVYHIFFDLNFLHIVDIPLNALSFQLFLYPIGTLFLSVVGVSLVVSYQNYVIKHHHPPSFLKYVKRSLLLFAIALLITGVTWIYPHDGFIVFGVIHCISISILFSYWFLTRHRAALLSGFVIILIGIYFSNFRIANPYLFWLGLKSCTFYSLDYFPLFPWLGVVLIGVFFGHHIYHVLRKKYEQPPSIPYGVKPLSFIGRHSLVIYLVHQPIIYGILFLFFQ